MGIILGREQLDVVRCLQYGTVPCHVMSWLKINVFVWWCNGSECKFKYLVIFSKKCFLVRVHRYDKRFRKSLFLLFYRCYSIQFNFIFKTFKLKQEKAWQIWMTFYILTTGQNWWFSGIFFSLHRFSRCFFFNFFFVCIHIIKIITKQLSLARDFNER